MKKISLLLFIIFTLVSCRFDVEPNVTVNNDINLTIDGENLDGVQGKWIIKSEDKTENGKDIIVITIEKNKIKGFGYAILLWLFLAMIYDGIFLMSLILFEDYPLDKLSLVGTMLNPIDLSRTLILLKLDISALLGYTGAIFKQFFGTSFGLIVSFIMLTAWVILPVLRITYKSKKKDF